MADILAVLSTHELIILTKFDEDWTKIVDFLLALYFWSSIIFFNHSLPVLGCLARAKTCPVTLGTTSTILIRTGCLENTRKVKVASSPGSNVV